jgi:hypothetical protein
LEKLQYHGIDAHSTHLLTNYWYLDTATDDGSLKADRAYNGYDKRLNHLNDSKL